MKRWIFAPPVFALLILLLSVAAPARAVMVDGIAAVVNGEIVTLLDLEVAGRMILGKRLQDVPAAERDRVRRETLRPILDQLILNRLQAQRARRLGIQVSSQEVDAAIAGIMEDNRISAEVLDRLLQEQGLTREEFRREKQDQIRLSKLVQQEIRTRVTVSDEEIQNSYEQRKKEWYHPEKIRMRHILLPLPDDAPPEAVEAVRQKALAILEQFRQGTDFGQLIRIHAPETVKEGEEPAASEIAKGELFPDLETAAFALTVGDVSEPIRSPAGFHLVQVTEKTPSSQQTIEAVRSSIEQKLAEQKTRERYDAWLKGLRENAFVEIKY